MSQCFKCGDPGGGRKRWYTFAVDRQGLGHLDRIDVRDGKITRLLCKDCATKLQAQSTSNPHMACQCFFDEKIRRTI